MGTKGVFLTMNETSEKIDVENRTQENYFRAVCHDLNRNEDRNGNMFVAGRGRNLDQLLRNLYNREIDEGQPDRLTEFVIEKFNGEIWEEVELDL